MDAIARCKYNPDEPFVPFLVTVDGKDVPVIPPGKPKTPHGPPAMLCQHCLSVWDGDTTNVPCSPAVITSSSAHEQLSQQKGPTSHASNWPKCTEGTPYSTTKNPTVFWAHYNQKECLVVPPTNFEMICAGCVWRLKTFKVKKFHSIKTCAKKSAATDGPSCRELWMEMPLTAAVNHQCRPIPPIAANNDETINEIVEEALAGIAPPEIEATKKKGKRKSIKATKSTAAKKQPKTKRNAAVEKPTNQPSETTNETVRRGRRDRQQRVPFG